MYCLTKWNIYIRLSFHGIKKKVGAKLKISTRNEKAKRKYLNLSRINIITHIQVIKGTRIHTLVSR